ncbi:STE/STE20/YSK protein kinase [Phakopsora pachyrhizi]|uniref:non-specific serine/threonine protein kinase n=1 Tax=Phakopsora pachyrhizi TaxID=170000 RepID=A0AAV0BS00_PHAPC|nr:STE/STE20/YSK protein kinase [Phakopsora pachyrhizi]CAH7688383.1 STE/STE20/YSK protein kinase [Phakopsora pachyrhizi]
MPSHPGSSTTASVNSNSSSGSTSAVLNHIQSHRDVPVEQLFTRLDIVGKGAYGAVYKGIHNATRTVLALKVINLDTAEDDIIEIQREVALLSQLRDSDRHNCIGYHGCYFYKTELWIAMDFASGGSIRTLLKPGKIEERYTQLIIRETLIGLNYLHKQEIIHRDIKSANILLTNSNRILLCDFGIAAPLQTSNHKRSTFIGTPYWMAPEVITDGKLYDTKADIWSLGITLYEMLNGNPPYSDLTPAKVILKIPRSQPAKLEGSQFSNGVKEFLAACLIDEPNDRPTAEDLMKHKWIKSISKASLSPLKDLTTRYSRWINSGGVRQSLADIKSFDITARPDSVTLDKSDWDFVDDHESFQNENNGNGTEDTSERSENRFQDGAATVRPPHQNYPIPRQGRPHRLMKLFEEDPSCTPQMGLYGGNTFQNPFSPNPLGGSQHSPLVGLGFPVPGLPSSSAGPVMEYSTPTISIPSAEELDQYLEAPSFGNISGRNSPSDFNRSTTPTPTSFQRSNQGGLPSSGPAFTNLNKMLLSSDPPLISPGGPTSANSRSYFPCNSPTTNITPSSPSLPILYQKELPDRSASSRNRANTAPQTHENKPPNTNSGQPPSFNRGNYGGGTTKQFAGNGFSFGGPATSLNSNSQSTNERERNGKGAVANFHNFHPPNTSTSVYPLTSTNSSMHTSSRSRSTTESSELAKSQSTSLSSSTGSLANSVSSVNSSTLATPTVPSKQAQLKSLQLLSGPVKSIPSWPTAEMMKIKPPRALNYQALGSVQEVKSELEVTLSDLSRWLETCDVGLGLLLDSMK